MPVRQYQLRIGVDELLDKMFDALRHDTVVEDIVGEEMSGNLAHQGSAQTRQFRLKPYEIERADDIIIVAQDKLAGEWASISVGDSVVLQVASSE